MKKNIHPKFYSLTITCSCHNKIKIQSIINKNFNIDICYKCHPFYTGKQRIIDTEKRIDMFNKRFNK